MKWIQPDNPPSDDREILINAGGKVQQGFYRAGLWFSLINRGNPEPLENVIEWMPLPEPSRTLADKTIVLKFH
jgi:hypothetical protein